MRDDQFTLDGEHETPNGWLYTFTLASGDEPTHHELTLSWVDHEHLVGGTIAPERVARCVFAIAIERFGDAVPARFDVASLARRIEGFEGLVRERLQAP